MTRRSSAPKLLRLAVRVLPLLLVMLVGCKKKKPFPPAPQLSSTATTDGARLDSGLTPVPMPAVTTAPPGAKAAAAAVPADTTSSVDRAALDKMKALVADLENMAKRGVLTIPEKPDDGDANMKCTALETPRARVETLADPEAKKLVAEAQRLCSFEVPLLNADHALKQLSLSPSQASRRLMCGMATKDLEKARAVKPNDRRVRDLDGRLGRACK